MCSSDLNDLDRVAGVQIAKPDGTASLIVNGQDEVMAVGAITWTKSIGIP